MHDSGVEQEVHARQRVPHEEVVRQHVTLQPVARSAGGDEVAVRGNAAPRPRVYVIDGRMIMLEPGAAVHAAPAAVAHYGALERSLEIDVAEVGTTPPEKSTRRAGEADAMNAVPRHCTSPKCTSPRAGWGTRAGRCVVVGGAHQRVATTVGRRCSGSEEGRRSTLMSLQSLIGRGCPLGLPARLTNAERNVGAQGRGASAFHIFDGGIPKKVTEPRPTGAGSDACAWGPVTRR